MTKLNPFDSIRLFGFIIGIFNAMVYLTFYALDLEKQGFLVVSHVLALYIVFVVFLSSIKDNWFFYTSVIVISIHLVLIALFGSMFEFPVGILVGPLAIFDALLIAIVFYIANSYAKSSK